MLNKKMAHHVQELSHQNNDEEILLNVNNNGHSGVINQSEISSNAGTNRNTSHSTVRNSSNLSSQKELLKKVSDELAKLNRRTL